MRGCASQECRRVLDETVLLCDLRILVEWTP